MDGAFPIAARKFSPRFKKRVVFEFEPGDSKASLICREHNISDSLLGRWLRQYREHADKAWLREDPEAQGLVQAGKHIAEAGTDGLDGKGGPADAGRAQADHVLGFPGDARGPGSGDLPLCGGGLELDVDLLDCLLCRKSGYLGSGLGIARCPCLDLSVDDVAEEVGVGVLVSDGAFRMALKDGIRINRRRRA